MTRFFPLIFLLLAFGKMAAQPLQLAPPQTPSTRLFAKAGQTLTFDFRLASAEIRYTTDGSEPTEASPIYTQPITTKGLELVKAKSFKQGFTPSATTTVYLMKPGSVPIDSMAISPSPKQYEANGWKTLCDSRLGDDNFHQNWLGFETKEVEATVFFTKKTKISKISVGYLQNQGAWIFGPAQVQVYDQKGRLLTSYQLPNASLQQPSAPSSVLMALPKGKHKALTIKVSALPAIPDWHPGKGNVGWLFLDEIVVW